MKMPCIDCENKGCGTYHDVCIPYKEYTEMHKLSKEEYRKRYDFARKERKPLKGHKGWANQKNISF